MPQRIISIGCFVLALCVSVSVHADTRYPLTVTDDLGRSLTLEKAPERVSSKTLFTDELLIELVPQTWLTSVTHLAEDSDYSNVAGKVDPDIQKLDLSVEAILANQPDILFAANWSDSGRIAQLQSAGIAVYCIETPLTIAGIIDRIQTIGLLLNRQSEADELIRRFQNQLEQQSEKARQLASQRWVALDYNSWGTANGRNTTWQAVLDGAGLVNGAARFEQGAFGQVALSKELIVAVNPDVLFIPGDPRIGDIKSDRFYQQVINDPALANVNAVINGRVYRIPDRLRGTYSHYIADTIDYVIDTASQHATD